MRVIVRGMLFVVLLFIPVSAFADGVGPITYIFTPETSVVASIVLGISVLVEAVILACCFKELGFKKNFLRSLLVNLGSSAGGSVLYHLWASWPNSLSGYLLDSWSLVIPLLIFTIVVEFPLIRYLYRKRIQAGKALGIAVVLNLASYAVIYGLFFALIYIVLSAHGIR